MLAIQEVNELSYESFMETFGNTTRSSPLQERSSTSSDSTDNRSQVSINQPEHSQILNKDNAQQRKEARRKNSLFSLSSNDSNPESITKQPSSGGKRKRLRKISMDRLSSLGGAVQAVMMPRRTKNSASVETVDGDMVSSDRRFPGFYSNLTPNFSRRAVSEVGSTSSEDADDSSGCSSRKSRISNLNIIPSIPTPSLASSSHRGFLDCRNKKKQWERFWCVLQDTCIYCYHTPQSDVVRDAILLRGYDVVADVTNVKRTRFVIKLQQQGVPNLRFSTDNHRDFLLWAAALEKETRPVSATNCDVAIRRTSTINSQRLTPDETTRMHRASLPNLGKLMLENTKLSALQEDSNENSVKIQKNKLLKEIADQQKQIMEEQIILDKTQPAISRNDVMSDFERSKDEEELKALKFMTFLNRRRNSVQIKVDQWNKDLKTDRRRRDNYPQFSAMESRLKEMQEALSLLDREVEEEKVKKLRNLEKLEYKRDLELMIVEQRDAIRILQRHSSEGQSHARRRRRHSDFIASPSVFRSSDVLTSIDEMQSFSKKTDKQSLRHDSYDVRTEATSIVGMRSKSDPCTSRLSAEGATSSDADSGFQPSSGQDEVDSSPLFQMSHNVKFPSAHSKGSNVEFKIDLDSGTYEESCSMETSSRDSTLKSKSANDAIDEIEPSILAQIEDFELFAKLKLGETKRT